jgi:hypothetical protein
LGRARPRNSDVQTTSLLSSKFHTHLDTPWCRGGNSGSTLAVVSFAVVSFAVVSFAVVSFAVVSFVGIQTPPIQTCDRIAAEGWANFQAAGCGQERQ